MKKLLIVLMILLLAGCSNPEPGPNEILFNTVNSTPVITVDLNGKYARLLVDTGASLSILHKGGEDKYGFRTTTSEDNVSGIGGTIRQYNTFNVNISYKDSTLNIPFKAANLNAVHNSIYVDGIIGSDWLKRNDVIIDFRNNKLILNED